MIVLDALAGWFAKGLLSFVFIYVPDDRFAGWLGCQRIAVISMCFPGDCFAGGLGQIISKACFHVFSLVSQIVSFLVGLATSTCQRFACMISLVRSFCYMFAVSFMCVPDECFAGWLGQIILPKLFFRFFSPKRFTCEAVLTAGWLCWMPWPDDMPQVCFHLLACLSQMIALGGLARPFCQRFCFHLFSCLSQMIALLDGLGSSFCQRLAFILFMFVCQVIALPDGFARSCCHRFFSISIFLFPRWLLCWMAWHGLAGSFCQSFVWCVVVCGADDCFAGWLGQVILTRVCFLLFSVVSQMIALLVAWPMAWPNHFATGVSLFPVICLRDDSFAGWHGLASKGLLSCPLICLPDDCFAVWMAWQGWARSFCQRFFSWSLLCWMHWRDDLPMVCSHISFHAPPRRLLCRMAWPDHFANGLLSWSVLCWMAWSDHFAKGLLSSLVIFIPDECFAGWLGQIILPQVFFLFL